MKYRSRSVYAFSTYSLSSPPDDCDAPVISVIRNALIDLIDGYDVANTARLLDRVRVCLCLPGMRFKTLFNTGAEALTLSGWRTRPR